jgi:hypothetical protein
MAEMCKLIYNDYDRIVDKVMWLGFGTVLNFNVDLFYIRKDIKTGEKIKENFHKEIMYKQNDEDSYRVKISRDFTYYFSIDLNRKDLKDRVIITPNDIYFVLFNLKKVMKWFIGEDGVNNIFMKNKSGRLFIPTHPDSIKINLSFNSYIEFEPAIESVNGYDTIGVKVYLNNDGTFFFMNSNTLFSLYHMLSTSNIYIMAQNMLNYIGRPEYGTNSFNMNETYTNSVNSNKSSFFNRVGAVSNNTPEGN